MALIPTGGSGDDTYVGLFMVEQPPDWWLPDGYSLTPTGAAPMIAWDPAGQPRTIYPIPGYRPPAERVDSIAEVIEAELGPAPTEGIGPKTRQALGMNRTDLLGTLNRAVMAPINAAVLLFDLGNYGIDAAIVAGTEGAYRAGWMSQTEAGQLRRDLMLMSLVAGTEAGRAPREVTLQVRGVQMRVAAMARATAQAVSPVVLRVERSVGVPFGRMFRVVEVLRTDPPPPGAVQVRIFDAWLARMKAGKAWEVDERWKYDFSQLYIQRDTGKGYCILDGYGPNDGRFAPGPVSQNSVSCRTSSPSQPWLYCGKHIKNTGRDFGLPMCGLLR